MHESDLVSIALPVRNGAGRLEAVVRSVLAQDHPRIELVISDNASTDGTEELCRDLAAADPRIVYHRHPQNVGLLGNFMHAARISKGAYVRWIGDDDRLEPDCVSAALAVFAADERLILVTNQVSYTGPDGEVTVPYTGTRLGSDDPVERFAEMLRLLNESPYLIDPLYGLLRREAAVGIPRRNMLREDEVFAAKLALSGPWAHVPAVLSHRNWRLERIGRIARRLDVPSWQSHLANTLQCRELLRWVRDAELTEEQRRRARSEVMRMYARRQRRTLAHRGRKLLSLVGLV
ncbi:glycosyltransferase involved in cell wall biosynthesis [Nonomuraea thailandensis]|uniref:Glycosyltransferase involved in cell wall biosynthesis n=1 Tax=Nonomuraea thailandensis TaxID=1188745 RepID=A0A9X2GYH8_9ACTN|nr:glycosyltransferase family 2 protein [Nonomuraea thailandensis]MCP2362683.1 glycosyltransferase involved in cell wall biosynthesis [Nonomuraea thailandensis]